MEWLVVLFVSFVLAVYTVLGIRIVRVELAYRRAEKRRVKEIENMSSTEW